MLCFITVSKFIIFVTTYINIVIINGYKYNYVTMNDDANFTLRADQRKFFRNLTSIVKLETKDIVNLDQSLYINNVLVESSGNEINYIAGTQPEIVIPNTVAIYSNDGGLSSNILNVNKDGISSSDVLLKKSPKFVSLSSGGSNSPFALHSFVIDLNLNKRKGLPFNPALL